MVKMYNPFKMWGSYLGFIVALVITFFGHLQCFATCPFWIIRVEVSVAYLIIGFIVGWGIHSLVRNRKR